ncbi:glycosyltransferase family 39 protein [Egbenema bharatensis]|uniref:glycosyltransferase family 39 protein n=1 Tax=Egbenema bharatensis TaxID=3463334 RepID=UPI003A864448
MLTNETVTDITRQGSSFSMMFFPDQACQSPSVMPWASIANRMKQRSLPSPRLTALPLVFVLTIVLALGIFVRVTHLGQKVYWHDEVFTSLRAAGHNGSEVTSEVFTGEVILPETLLQYQRLSPDRGWSHTWQALTSHPEHPPLYYLLARVWMELFGSETAIVRSLSVGFSLLAFPALYWLCQELFHSPFTGWIAIGLLSISPFHVLYAQEARQSSLWTLATLLSSAALVRAMRLKTWASWGVYAATIALNLYTFLFSVLVVMGHGFLVILSHPILERWGRSEAGSNSAEDSTGAARKSLQGYLLAVALGLIAFMPWLIVLVQEKGALDAKTFWTTQFLPKDVLIKLWGLHFSSNFIDLGLPLDHLYTYIAPPIVLLLLAYSLWVLYRHAPRPAAILIPLLILLPSLTLMLPDLIWEGQRSSQTRYFVPMLVGGQLAVAHLLSRLMQHPSYVRQRVGRGLLAVLLTAGIISCGLSWQAKTWWSKGVSYTNAETAAFLNQFDQPVVVGSSGATSLGNVISLSYLVHPQVRFQLVKDPAVPDLAEGRDRFLYFPSEMLIGTLQTVYSLNAEAIEQDQVALLRLVEPE